MLWGLEGFMQLISLTWDISSVQWPHILWRPLISCPHPTLQQQWQPSRKRKKETEMLQVYLPSVYHLWNHDLPLFLAKASVCKGRYTHCSWLKKTFPWSSFSAAAQQDLPCIWQPGHSAGQSNSPVHLEWSALSDICSTHWYSSHTLIKTLSFLEN